MECLKIILPIINTWILAYIGYQVWKKQEIYKNQKETGLKYLGFLERYSLKLNAIRNGKFQLYDTEESIYQERWNQLVKSWDELQNESILTKLLFPKQKEEITLINLSELQNELKRDIDTYLDRKRRGVWNDDQENSSIKKLIFKIDDVHDEFGEKIQNEINSLSNPIKTQLEKQFNIKF